MSSFPPPGDGTSPPPGGDPGDDGGRGAGTGPSAPSAPSDAAGQHGRRDGGAGDARPTVPLRPLQLGDMFDGAFRTIRRNPGATIGVAFLVNLAFLVIPVVGLALLSVSGGLGTLVPDLSDPFAPADPAGGLGTGPMLAGLLSLLASLLAGVVVTGLVVQVVARAAIGERLGAGEAWRRTRPRMLGLLALTLLSALLPLLVVVVVAAITAGVVVGVGVAAGVGVAVLLGLAAVVAVVWAWTRYLLLAPCVLVLERCGVATAVRRSSELSRGSSWRLLGTYVLISLLAQVVASIVALPLTIGSLVSLFTLGDGSLGTVLVLTLDNLGTVVAGALATPFIGAVVALQYLDVRMRREGLDVRLQQQRARSAGPGAPAS